MLFLLAFIRLLILFNINYSIIIYNKINLR